MKYTREAIKRAGGKLIDRKSVCSGEIVYQLWQLPDGRLFRGDDWYNDHLAFVYPVTVDEWNYRMTEEQEAQR